MPQKRKSSPSAPDPSASPARCLNINQAAAYMNCKVWFVRNLAWNNTVPHIRLGCRIVFDKSDLDAYIDRMKQAA
jgi:excisionase family DNA binding protein